MKTSSHYSAETIWVARRPFEGSRATGITPLAPTRPVYPKFLSLSGGSKSQIIRLSRPLSRRNNIWLAPCCLPLRFAEQRSASIYTTSRWNCFGSGP